MLVTEIIKPKCGFEYKYDFREIEELLRQGTSIQNSSGLQQPMFKPHAGRTPNQASPRRRSRQDHYTIKLTEQYYNHHS